MKACALRKRILARYVLGSSQKEMDRLNIQSALFEKETIQTLKLAGIKEGMRCLDVGCGTGHTTLLISDRVGKNGKVIGLDINEANIHACKENLNRTRNNLEFVLGDLLDMSSAESSFDFIYSRFLFQHLIYPENAIAKMSTLTAHEGIIAIEELDQELWLSYPFDPNLEKLQKAYVKLLKLSGSDPFVARKLYRMFLRNGLNPNIAAYSICVKMSDRPNNKIGVLLAEVLKKSILKNNLMSQQEFDQMLNGLKKYATDPTGLVLYAIAFRIWARKNNDKDNRVLY